MADSAVSFDWAINIYKFVLLTWFFVHTMPLAFGSKTHQRRKANSHTHTHTHTPPHTHHVAPRPCRVAKVSHLIYATRPCWIHTYHAVPMSCSDHAALKATFQGHGIAWHSLSRDGQWATCPVAASQQLLRRHSRRLNQKAAAFCDMFNCCDEMETADCTECEVTLS
jgi:hypothetical protein